MKGVSQVRHNLVRFIGLFAIVAMLATFLAATTQGASAYVEGGIPPDVMECEEPQDLGPDGHYFDDAEGICYNVTGDFWYYWRSHGLELGDEGVTFSESLALFGYPITRAFQETFEDGTQLWVQYFERARFEFHEGNQPEFQVLQGHFGRDILSQYEGHEQYSSPAQPQEDCRYFEETSHNLCGDFLWFWENNGGLMVFGYPLMEATHQELPEGTFWVQYFERARFELHEDLKDTPYYVLLGHFGRTVLEMRMSPPPSEEPAPPSEPEIDCAPQEISFEPAEGKVWEIDLTGKVAIVNVWSNWPDTKLEGEKQVLIANMKVRIKGGGSATIYPALECSELAREEMEKDGRPDTTIEKLVSLGVLEVVSGAPPAPIPGDPPTPTPPTSGVCEVVHEGQLYELEEVSGDVEFLHLQFYFSGQPEYETLLPPGRYQMLVVGQIKGWVWELGPSCSAQQALDQHVGPSINRRREAQANVGGYVHWTELVNAGYIKVLWQPQPVPEIGHPS